MRWLLYWSSKSTYLIMKNRTGIILLILINLTRTWWILLMTQSHYKHKSKCNFSKIDVTFITLILHSTGVINGFKMKKSDTTLRLYLFFHFVLLFCQRIYDIITLQTILYVLSCTPFHTCLSTVIWRVPPPPPDLILPHWIESYKFIDKTFL